MNPRDLVGMAHSNLWRRKLRTSLTILAVVIGATLIALMVSLGTGLQGFIVNQFQLMVHQDAIMVSAGDLSFGHGGPREITDLEGALRNPFTKGDVERIRAIDGVERIDYRVSVPALYITPEGSDKRFTVNLAPVPAYEAGMRPLLAGETFTADSGGQCIIGYDYLKSFQWPGAAEALGKRVSITVAKRNPYRLETRDYTFTVVGIAEKTMNPAEVLIPLEDATEMARYYEDAPGLYSNEEPGFSLQVKVADHSILDEVAEAIRDLDFRAITPGEILGEINNVFSIIQIGLSVFGIIALVVAAIGIINTLVMAIYERTREIGVMKAVGATKGTIRLLFTVEGAVLGFLGGAIGVALGWVLGLLLNFIAGRTFLSDFPNFQMAVFPPWLILGVIGLTTAIALLAALYPAHRAAELDPVEALRYE